MNNAPLFNKSFWLIPVAMLPFLDLLCSIAHSIYGIPMLPYPALALCLPASLFGLLELSRNKRFSFVLKKELLFIGVIATLSLGWCPVSERGRGLIVLVMMFLGFPISRLIKVCKFERHFGLLFCFGCVFYSLLVFFFTDNIFRLGDLSVSGVGRLSNANAFAATMAGGIVICLSSILNDELFKEAGSRVAQKKFLLPFFFFITLSFSLIFSGSRTSLICYFLILIVFLLSIKNVGLKITLIPCAVAICIMHVATEPEYIQVMSQRMQNNNVGTLGDRLEIWRAGVKVLKENVFFGVGIGGVEKQLPNFLDEWYGAKIGDHGIARKAIHNTYLEWVISTGLLGLLVGCYAVPESVIMARRVDKQKGQISRTLLIIFFSTIGVSTTVYRLVCWIPLSALFFALMTFQKTYASKTVVGTELLNKHASV